MKTRLLAAALTVAFAGGLGTAAFVENLEVVPRSHAVAQAADAPATATGTATAMPTMTLPDFSALVEREGPAVVNIAVKSRAGGQTPPGMPPGDVPEFFRRFVPQPDPGEDGPMRQGNGSGFIVSADGYVLTNTHVVKGADEVIVTLTDRREFSARVVGTDDRTDVALLKIDGQDLPTVHIGNPDGVKVGHWVAAIGSPFGLQNTVTAGIVSAKSRTLPSDAYVPFIQTDVAVNPGNSGGPLFNLAGEVVGINSQIYSRTGGYMGLSFAIPIDVAMKVKDDLLKYGKVQRGRIGVRIQPVTKELAATFGLDQARGALVSGVDKGTPGEAAGLKAGDIILSVNGKSIEQSVDLPRMVGETRPGTEITMEIWRDRAAQRVRLTLGEMPAEQVAQAAPPVAKQTALGLSVRPLTPAEKQKLQTQQGVVVEKVEGAAAKAGIRPGDVILSLNSEPVDSVERLKRLLENARDRVAVLVQREETKFFVPVPLS